MNENQINAKLFNVPGYLGTFALDELNQFRVRSFPSFLIVNLDLRKNKGLHWIAIAIYLHDVFICDSLGTLFPSTRFPVELVNFLHLISHNKSLQITKQLQDEFSASCGKFASYFVYKMSKDNSYYNFLSCFGSDYSMNDLIISLLFKTVTS